MLRLKFRSLGNKGSASVELALVSVFFLLPLFAGSADMVDIISAKAQTNTALRALYSFDWTNSSLASVVAPQTTNIADLKSIIGLINKGSVNPISFPSSTNTVTPNGTSVNGSSYFVCIPTVTTNPTLTQASPCPTTGSNVYTQQVWVTYQVNSTVFLPVPMPFASGNQLTLTASGSIQVQ